MSAAAIPFSVGRDSAPDFVVVVAVVAVVWVWGAECWAGQGNY